MREKYGEIDGFYRGKNGVVSGVFPGHTECHNGVLRQFSKVSDVWRGGLTHWCLMIE